MRSGLYIITGVILAGSAWAEGNSPSSCAGDGKTYAGYVVGKGEGGSYEEAKATALGDAGGFFGVQLDSSAEVSEESNDTNDTNGVYFSSSIKTTISTAIKGAEVLAECKEGGSTKVTVGIKKSTVKALLDQQAEHRLNWIKAKLAAAKASNNSLSGIRQAAKQALEDEKADLEAWTLLQQPKEFFKAIPDEMKQELLTVANKNDANTRYHVKANGSVADRSLPTVLKLLRSRGVEVTADGTGTPLTWSCNVDRGTNMGSSVRFSGECSIVGDDVGVESVNVSGISSASDVEATAARLVNSKLQAAH